MVETKSIPESEKWKKEHIFSSEEAWKKNYEEVSTRIDDIKRYQGNITNAKELLTYLTKGEEISQKYSKLYVYAMLSHDEDTRVADSQARLSKVQQLGVKLSSATSFFTPFLLSLDEQTLSTYIKQEEGLQYFEEDLFDTYRYKEHVLSAEQEALLSEMGEALQAPRNTYGMINNADITFGYITNDQGEKERLTRGKYALLSKSSDREKRKEAYEAYYEPYIGLHNTIGSTLSAAVKNNVKLTKLRNYPSALEKALFGDKVPKEVYETLIQAAHEGKEALHAYTKERKKILNVNELRPYDLGVPLVEGVKYDISYDEAYEMMLKALSPLGEDYVSQLKEMKVAGVIDVHETPGKRSGAYNIGVYGVHPYVLLNHRNDLDSLFTLTHEMGHAMHSYYSNKHQPHITAGYSIFVAEVASTVNEVLLMHHLIDHEKDDKKRRYLLHHFIDQFKGTFFTQVMFAEFEKIVHEKAEKEEPLNASAFNEVYEELFGSYHGESLELGDEVKYGWSRIPHFYRPFYVYKYATGYASAIHIADRLLKGDEETKNNYLEFLKSGSSDYPLNLLKRTGVDLEEGEPIRNALNVFSGLVKEFSKE
jgi:oligoendopeptidase F